MDISNPSIPVRTSSLPEYSQPPSCFRSSEIRAHTAKVHPSDRRITLWNSSFLRSRVLRIFFHAVGFVPSALIRRVATFAAMEPRSSSEVLSTNFSIVVGCFTRALGALEIATCNSKAAAILEAAVFEIPSTFSVRRSTVISSTAVVAITTEISSATFAEDNV